MSKEKNSIITKIGIFAMILVTMTQFTKDYKFAGYSVLIGIAAFFIDCFIGKKHVDENGLSFTSLHKDLKKPGVLLWMALPIVTAILSILLGDLFFGNTFHEHILTRAGAMLQYKNIPLFIMQVIILALGEEIAWRGFFVGKTMQKVPFVIIMIVSSMLFAMGHLSTGTWKLLLFDILFVFIDSCIFAVIFKKSDNCAVSAIAHIVGNCVGIAVCFLV